MVVNMIPLRTEYSRAIAGSGRLIIGYIWKCARHSIAETEEALYCGMLKGYGINRDACGLPQMMLDKYGNLVIAIYGDGSEL
jgi:hypothetical protein